MAKNEGKNSNENKKQKNNAREGQREMRNNSVKCIEGHAQNCN